MLFPINMQLKFIFNKIIKNMKRKLTVKLSITQNNIILNQVYKNMQLH